MATTTTNFGWDIPQSTDLVKDGATAIAALGQDIDTAMVDLKGGTTGQVLAKASGTDLDFSWVAQDDSNAIQNAIVDAKGDLIAATAADTPARLAVGTNGYVLTADSAEATGMKWAAAAGGGKVLQVVTGTLGSAYTTTSTSYSDIGLSATITPSSASSRILVITTHNTSLNGSGGNFGGYINLLRTSTSIQEILKYQQQNGYHDGPFTMAWVDSPSTTSATTYKTQGKVYVSATWAVNTAGTQIILAEIGA
jgi:hypothetical protein